MTTSKYHEYTATEKAKKFVLSFIATTKIKDSGQLGFWSGIPLASDYPVLAVLYDMELNDGNEMNFHEFLQYLKEEVPHGFFNYVAEDVLGLDLPF